jgi:hypothetical protein
MLGAPRRIGVAAARIAAPTSSVNGVGMMEAPPLAFATNPCLAGVTGFETEYLSDPRRVASDESARQFAAIYVETASKVRALLHSLIDAQPDARNKAMLAEVDCHGRDLVWE